MSEIQAIASGAQLKPKILIVDDDAAMLSSLRLLLKANGHNAEAAQGGAEAIARLQTSDYDLMLLDLQMPGICGHEVLTHIRNNKVDTKVIVVSGETSFTMVKDALTEGAYDFVRKPYDAGELLTTINNGLQSRTLEQQHKAMARSLEESEKLHRYIVNNSPDIVYVLDNNGLFTFINDRIEILLGYKREDLIGKHYSVLVHEEDLAEANYVFHERRTGARASKDVELRLKINDEAKESRYFETHVLPIALHSMGMYNPQGLNGEREFIGTYGCARDITDRKRHEELINYQAYHDLLTSLPNRALFEDRITLAIAHARRYSENLAVMYLDVDRFKLVNDSMGHSMGDKLLQIVAERITLCLRAYDTLARFGGDEFTLLLPRIRTKEDAGAVAQKILDNIRAPIFINNQEIFISASIGIAMYPHGGETMETLVKSADIAMYHVKSNGKDGFRFFCEKMNDSFVSHLAVERDLHRALEQKQFEIHFQPKVNSLTCQIVGMEALLRWFHPEKGLVMPNDFIPLAEQTRLIIPIGDWVFRATCEEICRWREQGLPKIKVSINISAIQIEQDDFVKKIMGTLEELNLSGDYIEIEITESGLMKNSESAIQKLLRLRASGLTIAIDDFGTGYSSLSYLHKLPVNTIKIDRSFVKDIEPDTRQTCIVDAIAAMATGLKLHMVAEGVETVAQLTYLKNLGCVEVQGFLFGKPQSAQATMELMAGRPDGKLEACLVC
ncbi:MAG: two-component system response regulator [Deltaproteobacteria bacterium HGW-Deltaproteobacteria-4]|nr:MAG: two-component system response regulator [Deltaproteobacteria bacterium HGW-Deltaproteobacteria-4]